MTENDGLVMLCDIYGKRLDLCPSCLNGSRTLGGHWCQKGVIVVRSFDTTGQACRPRSKRAWQGNSVPWVEEL